MSVATSTGHVIAFDFPASAAGQTVTLTPDTAASIGWTDGRFDDVIRMEPDGAIFDDPIVVKPVIGDLLAFDFPSVDQKRPAEGLALNSTGDGLLLTHFSTLAVVPPEVSCDSTSGWVESAENPACAGAGDATSLVQFSCKAFSYCLIIEGSCCAAPGTPACELGMENLRLSYTPSDSNGGQYPYCDSGTGGTGG